MIIDFAYGSYGLHTVARMVAWTDYLRATDAFGRHAVATPLLLKLLACSESRHFVGLAMPAAYCLKRRRLARLARPIQVLP
jgi:hypothetical protein